LLIITVFFILTAQRFLWTNNLSWSSGFGTMRVSSYCFNHRVYSKTLKTSVNQNEKAVINVYYNYCWVCRTAATAR